MAAEPVPVIDAHQHFWHYTAAEYGWINDSMAQLRRDFLPAGLTAEMQPANVAHSIAVQARQSVEETSWLLNLAARHDIIAGVVGWAPLAHPAALSSFLRDHGGLPKLVGLRHIVQAEPDGFLDAPAFNDGIAALLATGLVYDILIFERQLAEAIRFVDRHPHQTFVLDHIAKPRIADAALEPWRTHILNLARRPNVVCKISGMVTEAGTGWTADTLRPYFDTAVEAFGPNRLMAGSDWPVCLAASGYQQWWQTLRNYFAGFTSAERDAIFGGTAASIYLQNSEGTTTA
jgi:L-fuconolactonase